MNCPPPASPRRRRLWPWVLALVLLPLVGLVGMAVSFLTLDRDAALLRREVMAASGRDWSTRGQGSVGGVTLWLVRQGLALVPRPENAEARAALRAVNAVSVGVYRPVGSAESWSGEQLFQRTDRAMSARGWTRVVAVNDRSTHVLVYLADDDVAPRRMCVAVANGRELVVVSATLDAEALADLVARHARGGLEKVVGEKWMRRPPA